jgi:Phage integrase, N-terminal SAM-like domain
VGFVRGGKLLTRTPTRGKRSARDTQGTPSNVRMDEYLQHWLAQKEQRVRYTTWKRYQQIVERQLVPVLVECE